MKGRSKWAAKEDRAEAVQMAQKNLHSSLAAQALAWAVLAEAEDAAEEAARVTPEAKAVVVAQAAAKAAEAKAREAEARVEAAAKGAAARKDIA